MMKSPIQSDTTNSASTKENRLHLERLVSAAALTPAEINAGSDAVRGLTQTPKSLPPKYFYDDRGSKLFELICQLPEYYLTRTETAILQGCAGAIANLTGPCEIVELGSTYELALAKIAPSPLPTRMICFLGSTLGNLNAQECDLFFSQIVGALQPGEYFLLGIDLDKSKDILEPAYDDSQGVTAAFNLNMLRHLNRKYEGNFDLAQFDHWAFYNQEECQIEMHLKSKKAQTVELRSLNLTVEFAAGETIRSEISRKFNLNTVKKELSQRGLMPVQVWTDPNQWFGLMLCQMSVDS